MNETIFYFFNSLAGRTPFMDGAIVFIAHDLPWILFVFTLVYFIFLKKSLKRLLAMLLIVLSSAFVSEFFKWIIFRHPRPFVVLNNVHQLIQISAYDSFPSTHATIFASLAMVMFIYNKKLGVLFFFFALIIGLARIAAGIHFPIDVLTGFAIGIIMSILLHAFFRRLSRLFFGALS